MSEVVNCHAVPQACATTSTNEARRRREPQSQLKSKL
jgi:hypothetical protein